MNRIEKLAKAFGILICLVFVLFPGDYSIIQLSIFGLILIAIGIPHGAIDHLITNPKIDRKGMKSFLLTYLTLIAAYILMWYFLPLPALVAFLVMSAYHFGQSHFIAEKQSEKHIWTLFTSRGGYFLFAILFGDWATTQTILSPLVEIEIPASVRISILIALLLATILAQLLLGPKFKINHLIELLILGPILYFSPLLIGFVVYFGFWHALPSMITEYKFLSGFRPFDSIKKFAVQLLPFSLISLIGIGLILFFGLKFLESSELVLLFFVMISLISFPHILYMDSFLKKQNQN